MGAFVGAVTGAGVGDPTQMEQLIGHVVRSNATVGQYVAATLPVTWLQLVTEASIVPCVSAVTVASLALAQSGAIVGATVGAASTLVAAANRTAIVSAAASCDTIQVDLMMSTVDSVDFVSSQSDQLTQT
jgi:hypothetical protein